MASWAFCNWRRNPSPSTMDGEGLAEPAVAYGAVASYDRQEVVKHLTLCGDSRKRSLFHYVVILFPDAVATSEVVAFARRCTTHIHASVFPFSITGRTTSGGISPLYAGQSIALFRSALTRRAQSL